MIFKRNFKKGFTLVELLVTITIFVILTGVVLFNQSRFNSTILLTNLAYDTALTIRQAQTYGINIKEFDNGSGTGNFVPYGVHFDMSANKSFILFADMAYDKTNPDLLTPYAGDKYSCRVADNCVNRYSVKRGNYISGICVKTQTTDCSPVSELSILFKRPNPDAVIYGRGDGETDYTQYSKATITLTGVDGISTRSVVVQENGLIEIKSI
jgi:prepilin-type N-terminal cleavage/methylation domain-containing protein